MHDESKRLFVEALTLAPDDREAFLLDSCSGDESLREEVESLLRHHDDLALTEETDDDERGGLRTSLRSVVRSWVQGAESSAPPPRTADDTERLPLD